MSKGKKGILDWPPKINRVVIVRGVQERFKTEAVCAIKVEPSNKKIMPVEMSEHDI